MKNLIFALILAFTSLSLYSQDTGELDESFNTSLSSQVNKTLELSDSTLLVAASDGIYLLDYDGNILNTVYSTIYPIKDMDTLTNGNIVALLSDRVYCFDINGVELWYIDEDTSYFNINSGDNVSYNVDFMGINIDENDNVIALKNYQYDSSNVYESSIIVSSYEGSLGNVNPLFNEHFEQGGLLDEMFSPVIDSLGNIIFSVKSSNNTYLKRLLPNGDIDNTYNTGYSFNGNIRSAEIMSDGSIVVVGENSINNGVVYKLNSDGTVDNSFTPPSISNSIIRDLIIDNYDNITIVGNFTSPENRILRLNENGVLDTNFIIGNGFDNQSYNINYSYNLDAFYVGGIFSEYNNVSTGSVVRLYGNKILNANVCYVTVDTSNQKSKVVWEKESGLGVDYYIIHKEITAGIYDSIGFSNFTDTNYFIDYNSSPESYIHRYRVSAVDSSGKKSTLSSINSTINVLNLSGTSGEIYLEWNTPEGISYVPSYTIFEVLSGGGLDSIASVPGSITSYTISNPTSPSTKYLVSVDGVGGCIQNLNKSSIDNYVFSNYVTENSTASIHENRKFEANIYPNPAQDYIKIDFSNSNYDVSFIIYDMSGRELKSNSLSLNSNINVSDLKRGAYVMIIYNEMNRVIKKFVKK